jgi:hypothetical protein
MTRKRTTHAIEARAEMKRALPSVEVLRVADVTCQFDITPVAVNLST